MGFHWFFHSVRNVITPTDELIFFRGVGIPPTSDTCLWLDIHGYLDIWELGIWNHLEMKGILLWFNFSLKSYSCLLLGKPIRVQCRLFVPKYGICGNITGIFWWNGIFMGYCFNYGTCCELQNHIKVITLDGFESILLVSQWGLQWNISGIVMRC